MTSQMILLFVFLCGYILLILEHSIKINKSAIALLMGVFSWMLLLNFGSEPYELKLEHLAFHLSDISQILFFLIGAMTIVELISAHQGFDFIRNLAAFSSSRKIFWFLLFVGFWLSSVLDNLTTILILYSLLQKGVSDLQLRQILAAGLIFVVNVGGAWTPIGDVTTTMLWIEGRIDTIPVMSALFIPSISSVILFGYLYSFMIPKEIVPVTLESKSERPPGSKRVFAIGILGLIAVPIMKITMNIPPFLGMMASLGVLWVVTDSIHRKAYERRNLKVEYILTKIDISCVLFFFGILLAIDALESSGLLQKTALASTEYTTNIPLFAFFIGVVSSVIDNVPLVAAFIKMYDVSIYPPNHLFWNLLAYCAGVGGSLLIIGSAPGVAIMSLSNIRFFWYVKKAGWAVLIAYAFGWGVATLF